MGFLLRSLALLSWVPESEVQQFYDEKSSEIQRDIQSCLNRDQWKSHKLYKEKKEALVTLCKAKNIEASGMNHELVERLALEQKEEPPVRPPMYQGQKELPRATKEIGQLSKSYLQSVLTYNGFPACGTKDELKPLTCAVKETQPATIKTSELPFFKREQGYVLYDNAFEDNF